MTTLGDPGALRSPDGLVAIRRPNDTPTMSTWYWLAIIAIVGATIRFWGLSSIGLHGDEEVMGLAARGILETGSPVIPSGMFYARALPQLYLMAASTFVFGDNEWAMRLPSACVGILAIVVAYFLGRRFLSVRWSLGLAAVIAVMPTMIAMSQTARMYMFFTTFVMLFAVAVFRWERTQSKADYALSVAACLGAASFHTLTIFAIPLFFYPLLTANRSWRCLVLASAAFAVCVAATLSLNDWIGAQYFPLVKTPQAGQIPLAPMSDSPPPLALIGGAIVLLLLVSAMAWRAMRRDGLLVALWTAVAMAGLGGALLFGLLGEFYMSGVALAVGAACASRAGIATRMWIAVAVLIGLALGAHAIGAWTSGEVEQPRALVLALVGTPSAFPWLVFSSFAPLAFFAYLVLSVYYVARFSKGAAMYDHFVLFLLGVAAPLFLLGFVSQHPAPRYMVGLLPLFLVAALAAFQNVVELFEFRRRLNYPLGQAVAVVVLAAVFVKPDELRHHLNPTYADYPNIGGSRGVDHKGAAEFVLSSELGDDDVVMAVDAQQQGYYLRDRLDYYVRSMIHTRNSTFVRDGRMVNLYTGTPQIANGREFEELVANRQRGRVFLLGAASIERNPQRYMGDGILEAVEGLGFERVYVGRDGVTSVWMYSAKNLEESIVDQ